MCNVRSLQPYDFRGRVPTGTSRPQRPATFCAVSEEQGESDGLTGCRNWAPPYDPGSSSHDASRRRGAWLARMSHNTPQPNGVSLATLTTLQLDEPALRYRRRGLWRSAPAVLAFETRAAIIHSTGCSAAWLARLTGGQEVGGSNPLSPIRGRDWNWDFRGGRYTASAALGGGAGRWEVSALPQEKRN